MCSWLRSTSRSRRAGARGARCRRRTGDASDRGGARKGQSERRRSSARDAGARGRVSPLDEGPAERGRRGWTGGRGGERGGGKVTRGRVRAPVVEEVFHFFRESPPLGAGGPLTPLSPVVP